MPILSRVFIKAGLAYLVAGLALNALPYLGSLVALPNWVGALRPVYLHLLMVGWITQLIFGVIYWMFPKYSKEHPRGSEKLAWFVFGSLNAGLLLRVVGEPLTSLRPDLGLGWVLVVSAILQLAAGWGFIANTWARVKER